MQTDTINISVDQFSCEDINPAVLAEQILALREAGFRVNVKINNLKAMTALQQIPAVTEQRTARRLAMRRLLSIALTASLGSMCLGFLMMIL